MPTLMQKIRLVIRGWNRRREEREREFLAKNTVWAPAPAGAGVLKPASTQKAIDFEGLTVAWLDDSGQFEHYLDLEGGEVIDTRDSLTGDRYRRVPSRSAQSEVDDRRAFVAALDPSATRDRLAACIGVAEAFRRTLATNRKLERAWYNFKNDRAIAAIQSWLREIGLQ
jgi:hypothetical protein